MFGKLKFYFERGYRFVGIVGWSLILEDKIRNFVKNDYLIWIVVLSIFVGSIITGYIDVKYGTYRGEISEMWKENPEYQELRTSIDNK